MMTPEATCHPDGPAALIRTATGTTPAWAAHERVTRNGHGGNTYVYRIARLAPHAMQQFAALTDPRVGWAVEIRPHNDQLRIRARKEHSHE